ncbi:MAG TPA: DUF1552 domain-containing protein [Bryobacteraceae bacterium]|nr:DUF1552 domain-containing protein [Bryobacteraceae bacterium]
MSFVARKHISRRAVLRGTGAAVALPLLDAMVPAFGGSARPVRRIGVVYVPNGVIMNQWTPAETGRDFVYPRILKPLEPYREQIAVISGLCNNAANKAQGGGHAKASGSFLSACPPKLTAGADVHAGTTFDQIAAKRWASETRVPSLQIGCEDSRMVGNCDTGSSCAYTNSLSWKDPDSPLAVETNPRSLFERLFGAADPSLDPKTRARRALYRRSILDLTRESARRLELDLGPADRRRMDEYLTSVREVEERTAAAEKDPRIPPIEKPSGIPFDYAEYVKLMFDLQAIAFQADLSRVTTMMLGREGSVRSYPEIEVPDPHHPLTHHRGHPDFIEKVTKINCFHVQIFAHFVGKLRATSDGDGTLLDHSAILYGGALSDGNSHSNVNLPLLVAGAPGRHIRLPEKTPAANLFVTLLNGAGIEVETFGDSTGRVDL